MSLVVRSEPDAEDFEDETAADDKGHECCDIELVPVYTTWWIRSVYASSSHYDTPQAVVKTEQRKRTQDCWAIRRLLLLLLLHHHGLAALLLLDLCEFGVCLALRWCLGLGTQFDVSTLVDTVAGCTVSYTIVGGVGVAVRIRTGSLGRGSWIRGIWGFGHANNMVVGFFWGGSCGLRWPLAAPDYLFVAKGQS